MEQLQQMERQVKQQVNVSADAIGHVVCENEYGNTRDCYKTGHGLKRRSLSPRSSRPSFPGSKPAERRRSPGRFRSDVGVSTSLSVCREEASDLDASPSRPGNSHTEYCGKPRVDVSNASASVAAAYAVYGGCPARAWSGRITPPAQ